MSKRIAKFVAEGHQGHIIVEGNTVFVQWRTLSCHLSAIRPGAVKGAACRALLNMNKTAKEN